VFLPNYHLNEVLFIFDLFNGWMDVDLHCEFCIEVTSGKAMRRTMWKQYHHQQGRLSVCFLDCWLDGCLFVCGVLRMSEKVLLC